MKTYPLAGCQVEMDEPVLVGAECGHFWFPALHQAHGRPLICAVAVSADVAQGEWPAHYYVSDDSGVSWQRRMTAYYGHSSVQLPDSELRIIPFEYRRVAGDPSAAEADALVVQAGGDGLFTHERRAVRFGGFPRPLQDYATGVRLLVDGSTRVMDNGRLMLTAYGRMEGDQRDCVFALMSEDDGCNWSYHGLVAHGGLLVGVGEGANESDALRLADGRWLCVFRTGAGAEEWIHQVWSDDDGETWSEPEPMPGIFSVKPKLLRLDSGPLLLASGRPGLFVWVCPDGTGEHWQRVDLIAHHNVQVDPDWHFTNATSAYEEANSTAYMGVQAIGHDELVLCYDRLANGWAGSPGPLGDRDAVFAVRIRVRR